MKKRILSFILAAVLTTQMVGTTVFAEQDAVGELSTVADNEYEDEDEAQNESSITTAASARAALFGMDTESTEKAAAAETENNVEKSLKTMYDGLNEAEGVLCKVSFEKGQTEKTFTIEILDNDLPQADRVVLMALMASTEGSISANGTAVL